MPYPCFSPSHDPLFPRTTTIESHRPETTHMQHTSIPTTASIITRDILTITVRHLSLHDVLRLDCASHTMRSMLKPIIGTRENTSTYKHARGWIPPYTISTHSIPNLGNAWYAQIHCRGHPMVVRRVASANNGESITYEVHHRARSVKESDEVRSYVYTYSRKVRYFAVSVSATQTNINVYHVNTVMDLTHAFGIVAALGLNRIGCIPYPAAVECSGRCFTLSVELEGACKGHINAEHILSSEETLSRMVNDGGLMTL